MGKNFPNIKNVDEFLEMTERQEVVGGHYFSDATGIIDLETGKTVFPEEIEIEEQQKPRLLPHAA